ncbi:MAG: non-canonical purine NTP pyrophosphatase [Actinomycetes bacterium]
MSGRRRVVLSTRNDHKVREFGRLLPGIEVAPLPPEVDLPPETGTTYAENALIKARAAASATGEFAIADDSGIEAEALNGAPGVRSARFAGEDATDSLNLALLIEKAPAGSGLRYVCVIAAVDPATGHDWTFEGECRGSMAGSPGGAGGFGYDPVFLPADFADGRTMAELSDAEKDAISHRGRAARALLSAL